MNITMWALFVAQWMSLMNETWNWFRGISILHAWLRARRRRNIFWIFDQHRIQPQWIFGLFSPDRGKADKKCEFVDVLVGARIMVYSCLSNQRGFVISFTTPAGSKTSSWRRKNPQYSQDIRKNIIHVAKNLNEECGFSTCLCTL